MPVDRKKVGALKHTTAELFYFVLILREKEREGKKKASVSKKEAKSGP